MISYMVFPPKASPTTTINLPKASSKALQKAFQETPTYPKGIPESLLKLNKYVLMGENGQDIILGETVKKTVFGKTVKNIRKTYIKTNTNPYILLYFLIFSYFQLYFLICFKSFPPLGACRKLENVACNIWVLHSCLLTSYMSD